MLGRGLESLIPKKGNNNTQKLDDSIKTNSDFYDDNATDGLKEEFDSKNVNSYVFEDKQAFFNENDGNDVDVGKIEDFISQDFEIEKGGNKLVSTDDSSINNPSTDILVFRIETKNIEFNPYQPRKVFDEEGLKELASSIREYGILQPLVVNKIEEETEYGTKVKYVLIAGQRRLMAARILGIKTVPAIIKNNTKNSEALEIAIVENIQREDLNVIERARAYAMLSDEFGLTQREIAVKLGKSREYVANALRLLSLPSDIQNSLAEGEINESHARIIMQVDDIELQKRLLDQIISRGLSTRELKKVIKKIIKPVVGDSDVEGLSDNKVADPKIKFFEKELSDFLGAPVRVNLHGKSGKIIIHFYSQEEAEGIFQKIKKGDETF